jgi:hypothetical protein
MSNNNITKKQAERLKEKGFDEKVRKFVDLISGNEIDDAPLENYNLTQHAVSVPEQGQVLAWFYINHGIWIYTYPVMLSIVDDKDYPKIIWISKICSLSQVNFEKYVDADNGLAVNHHRSPQDAISAAINYILNI